MRIVLLRRRLFTVAACAAVACAMFYLVNHPAIVGASAGGRALPIYSVQRDHKVLSLTFDAAWGDADLTPLLDTLSRYKIEATFFVTGDWAAQAPDTIRALRDAGHEVMNHSTTHPHLTQLSPTELADELTNCSDAIESLTGERPTLFRPPYGEYDDNVIRAVRAQGLEPILWDVDSRDWRDLSAEEIARRVTRGVTPGSIVLFHTDAANTAEALPVVVEALLRQGYSFAKVSSLLLTGAYTIDHTGRQRPA